MSNNPVPLSTKIRRILAAEFRKEKPAFKVVKHLEEGLKEALALEDKLSVDDVGKPSDRGSLLGDGAGITITGTTITGGAATAFADNNVFTINTGNTGAIYTGPHEGVGDSGSPPNRRRRASIQDEMLAMMDQITRRMNENHDPLAAVAQMLPNLEVLYPDPEERDAVLAEVRSQVQRRLTTSEEPPLEAETTEAEETDPPTTREGILALENAT